MSAKTIDPWNFGLMVAGIIMLLLALLFWKQATDTFQEGVNECYRLSMKDCPCWYAPKNYSRESKIDYDEVYSWLKTPAEASPS